MINGFQGYDRQHLLPVQVLTDSSDTLRCSGKFHFDLPFEEQMYIIDMLFPSVLEI